jgi:hypothetical protein
MNLFVQRFYHTEVYNASGSLYELRFLYAAGCL